MSKATNGLSNRQKKEVEEFLHLFGDVEAALKEKLGRRANDSTSLNRLIEENERTNSYWIESANKLRNLKDIRNLLTHQRNSTSGYPIAVAPSSITALSEIRDHLLKPERISVKYRKAVKTVPANDCLAEILVLAFENEFSQFPVVTDGNFGGLITENEITRWFGRRIKANSTQINLTAVTVRMVLKEKNPSLKGVPIFHFERLDAPAEEVMSQFSLNPALEVILLTESGDRHSPIEGIITQWDAARFPKDKQ